ncbi:MAG: hypothetical protein [Caudoviricetes sp.]|nr:MAG: hypothetical protein [Caudoviricetes sp.]
MIHRWMFHEKFGVVDFVIDLEAEKPIGWVLNDEPVVDWFYTVDDLRKHVDKFDEVR